MARPKKLATAEDEILTERQLLVKSSSDIASVGKSKRGWIFIHPHQDPRESFPLPVAINDWNATLPRGKWCEVPMALKSSMQQCLETRWRDVLAPNGVMVKEPYETLAYPFDWNDDFDARRFAGNFLASKKSAPVLETESAD